VKCCEKGSDDNRNYTFFCVKENSNHMLDISWNNKKDWEDSINV
jgi:hypothetical protein